MFSKLARSFSQDDEVRCTTGNPFAGKPNCKKFGGSSATLQKMFNYFEAEQIK
jgi:hypothetical protein